MRARDRDEHERFEFEYQLVNKLFQECEAHEREFLSSLKCPTDPAGIDDVLSGRRPAPWPAKTSTRNRNRAQRAMRALVHIAQARGHLGPLHQNARLAAHDALLAGLYVNEAITMLPGLRRQRVGQRIGGKQRGETITATASAQDTDIKRLYNRFVHGDDLRFMHLNNAIKYIAEETGLSADTIRRRLKHLKLPLDLPDI